MVSDFIQEESFYHSALCLTGRYFPGNVKSDMDLKKDLLKFGTFKKICDNYFGDSLNKSDVFEKLRYKIENIPFEYNLLTINYLGFPSFLSTLRRGTPVLYLRGDSSLLNEKRIAVVGTRRLENKLDFVNGTKALKRVLEKGYVVISGLAHGCDTLAHNLAAKEGRTIAVLGNPLNINYPSANKKLQEEIGINHLLVSQYPFGIKTFPNHYSHRNHTMVSLSSEGIVVIRADDKSGTQHAIRECVKQKKPVYVLENNLGKGYRWVENFKDSIKIIGASDD